MLRTGEWLLSTMHKTLPTQVHYNRGIAEQIHRAAGRAMISRLMREIRALRFSYGYIGIDTTLGCCADFHYYFDIVIIARRRDSMLFSSKPRSPAMAPSVNIVNEPRQKQVLAMLFDAAGFSPALIYV